MKRKINIVLNILLIVAGIPMAAFCVMMIRTIQLNNDVPYAAIGALIDAGLYILSMIGGILGLLKKKLAYYWYIAMSVLGFGTAFLLIPFSIILLPVLLLLNLFALITFEK